MTQNFLKDIVAHKKDLLKKKKVFLDALKDKNRRDRHTSYHIFQRAIAEPGKLNLIAEIKKASPSQGVIRPEFSVLDLAHTYQQAGAAALSVLTEEKYFLGKPPFVRDVSEHISLPVLTKDFIIDESQVYETFSFGSSAILLIVAILTDKKLKHLIDVTHALGMDALVEVHDAQELERAIDSGARIIGVNNRNLKTLKVDLTISESLIPRIPRDITIVAESGIKDHGQIKRLQELGAHAVLIGETFLRANDVGAKVREVMYG
jgi:indole-3-glycerol phosphate synthase